MQGLGLLSLRCVLGLVSIAHGLPKLLPMGSDSPRDIAALFEGVGLSPAYPLTVATGIVEVLGGALLTVGAYTFWSGLLLVSTILAVSWKLTLPNGFFMNWLLKSEVGHGYEFSLVLVAAILCVMLAEPGILSVDRRRARRIASAKLSKARVKAG